MTLLAFIDETGDAKHQDYLGLSIALVNAHHYPAIKQKAHALLEKAGWQPDVEFKGSHLFSSTKGCKQVPIEKRISLADSLLELNLANKNARMSFHFGRMKSEDHLADYMANLPGLLRRALPRPPKGAGENLLAVTCDHRDDLDQSALHAIVSRAASVRGYILMERTHVAVSSYDTVGLMYADLVGYLLGRIDNIASDAGLFENLSAEDLLRSSALRKLTTSKALADKLRQLTTYSHALAPALES